ncbi:MAG: basic amino acid ABC transporter substrate-binding protein [Dehalococcoidales bacterium]|nr:basic amino acid ABC transporter substrate-binding protein [Dehalococcoidales bacterium]
MKRVLSLMLVVIVAISLTLTGCTKTSTKIRVATDATWKPFEYVNEQTKAIEGFDIDLFNAIAAKAGIEVEYINVAWDPLLAGMAQGTYDAAISSITITADRAKAMLFSDPYFAAGQIVVVLKTNTTISGKNDLSGKKVGVQLGTTGNIEVDKIAGATSKPYDDIGLAFQDLMNGQVDAVVCDNPVALFYVGANITKLKTTGNVFTDEQYGIAVAKGKDDLLKKINDGLKKVKAAGTIETLSAKWQLGK